MACRLARSIEFERTIHWRSQWHPALVHGQWKLDRQSEPVSGNFTLVLRKIDGRWLIVHDHTSRLAE
jgi:ketosteroid isomerase-like protein